MLSVFQPARCAATSAAPYMPNKTAEYQGTFLQQVFNLSQDLSPLFLGASLPVCPDCRPLEDSPILLFSPGYGIPRLYYSVLVSAIASEGFTVISIDHPDDANIITYPNDQAVIYKDASLSSDAVLAEHVAPRVADASFVIDQLSNSTAMGELIPHRGPRPLSVDQVAMVGHSEGGVTAIFAAASDKRIQGAINWDGTILGPLPAPEMSQPVLFVGEATANVTPSWSKIWPQLKGPKLWFTVANTTHYTFCDVPTLLQSAGVNAAPLAGILDTISPAELVRILASYTTAWMKGAFRHHEGGPPLEAQDPREFPEVSTVMKANF